jgi:hypothetical protein
MKTKFIYIFIAIITWFAIVAWSSYAINNKDWRWFWMFKLFKWQNQSIDKKINNLDNWVEIIHTSTNTWFLNQIHKIFGSWSNISANINAVKTDNWYKVTITADNKDSVKIIQELVNNWKLWMWGFWMNRMMWNQKMMRNEPKLDKWFWIMWFNKDVEKNISKIDNWVIVTLTSSNTWALIQLQKQYEFMKDRHIENSTIKHVVEKIDNWIKVTITATNKEDIEKIQNMENQKLSAPLIPMNNDKQKWQKWQKWFNKFKKE